MEDLESYESVGYFVYTKVAKGKRIIPLIFTTLERKSGLRSLAYPLEIPKNDVGCHSVLKLTPEN